MLQKMKKRLKNQKGFTLIELLAVIVILGIIAAIAIPSIAGIINNSKKDAHIANAEMMVSAARTSVAANDPIWNANDQVNLQELIDEGYLEQLDSPGKSDYVPASCVVNRVENLTTGSYTYTVDLVAGTGDVTSSPMAPADMTRDNITLQ